MDVGIVVASGVKWFWENYGKSLIESSLGEVKRKWNRFKWAEAEARYRSRYMNFTVLLVYSQLPSTDGLQDVKEHQALRILDLLIRSVSDEKNKIVDFDNDSPVADEVSKFARSLEIIFSPSDLERLQELSID